MGETREGTYQEIIKESCLGHIRFLSGDFQVGNLEPGGEVRSGDIYLEGMGM